jgi:hypothetical protein
MFSDGSQDMNGELVGEKHVGSDKLTPDSIRVAIKASFGTGDRALVLGQSIHRHVPSVFAHGIDVGASRMQRLSAVSSTI